MSQVIAFACPECGKELKLSAEMRGRRGKCPACKNILTVPDVSVGAPPARPSPPSAPARPQPSHAPQRIDFTHLAQSVAEECRAKSNVLANIPAKKLQKIRQERGAEMVEGEVPLMLADDVLITDRGVYTSEGVRIPLENIRFVSKRRFHLMNLADRGPSDRLYVNGVAATTAWSVNKGLKVFLERIAAAHLAAPHSAPLSKDEQLLIAAAAALDRRESTEIAALLTRSGVDQAEAAAIAASAFEHANVSHRPFGLLLLLAGLALLGICFGLAWLMKAVGANFVVVLKGLGAVGAIIGIAGIFTLITGRANLEPEDLVARMDSV